MTFSYFSSTSSYLDLIYRPGLSQAQVDTATRPQVPIRSWDRLPADEVLLDFELVNLNYIPDIFESSFHLI